MTVSSISYAGYNLITTGAILAGMSHFLQDRKEAALASVMSGVVLFVMMLLIWTVLEIYYGKINLGEIPMLTMALRQNKCLGRLRNNAFLCRSLPQMYQTDLTYLT